MKTCWGCVFTLVSTLLICFLSLFSTASLWSCLTLASLRFSHQSLCFSSFLLSITSVSSWNSSLKHSTKNVDGASSHQGLTAFYKHTEQQRGLKVKLNPDNPHPGLFQANDLFCMRLSSLSPPLVYKPDWSGAASQAEASLAQPIKTDGMWLDDVRDQWESPPRGCWDMISFSSSP